MEKNSILNLGKKLILPFEDGYKVMINCEDETIDVSTMENVKTRKLYGCITITKFQKSNTLVIRPVKIDVAMPQIVVQYTDCGVKKDMSIDQENIEINTDDTVITLSYISDGLNIHIVSNDLVVTEELIKEEETLNEELKTDNVSFNEQYRILKEEYDKLMEENEILQSKVAFTRQENARLEEENESLIQDKSALEQILHGTDEKNKMLQKELNALCNQHGMTVDILKEYRESDQCSEIEEDLDDIEKQLSNVEKKLKVFISKRQEQVNKIRNTIKIQ